MRRIAILNQKGGVGKTTTAVNFGAALARQQQTVQLLDLDPQAHATTHLGLEPDGTLPSMYDVLVNQQPLAAVRKTVDENLWLCPADIHLAAAEVELAGVVGREVILKEALAADPFGTDILLMDCGPSLGVLTLNALAAADEVLIPLQPHFLALHGLSKLLETTALVCRRINPQLQVTGIIVCMMESQTKLAQEVIINLENFLAHSQGQPTPWSGAKVFTRRIRRNVKLAECPSHGQSIFRYAPNCPGAQDYAALAAEFLGKESVPSTLAVPEPVAELAAGAV